MRSHVWASPVATATYMAVIVLLFAAVASGSEHSVAALAAVGPAWWSWPVALFALTLLVGIVSPMAGIGGGVLFVPIVSCFFPFHLDFIRGCNITMAVCGALAASPGLLKMRLADLRLALPVAVVASPCAIAGAMVGLALPTRVVEIVLGAAILAIVGLMLLARRSTFPNVPASDALSSALRIHGVYLEASMGQEVQWRIHRTLPGLLLFALIGFLAGMFGLGAGWASVPVLNLVMGAPLKISVATSTFLLSTTPAAWVYLERGCVLPLMVVPSLVGMMLGSFIGARLLHFARPAFVRWLVIVLLLFSGLEVLIQGLDLPFLI